MALQFEQVKGKKQRGKGKKGVYMKLDDYKELENANQN